MHFPTLTLLFFVSYTSTALLYRATTFSSLNSNGLLLSKRQLPLTTCFGSAPLTELNPCEYTCGEGSRQCISAGHCFNPGKDETCCEDGTYCPANSYCSNEGCCDDSLSLEECGATSTIATLEGEYFEEATSTSVAGGETASLNGVTTLTAHDTTTIPSSSSSDVVGPTPTAYSPPSSSSTSTATSSSSSEVVAPNPSSHSIQSYDSTSSSYENVPILPTGVPAYPSTTKSGGNGTVPAHTPAQQTTNAGVKREAVGWALGGLSMLGVGLYL